MGSISEDVASLKVSVKHVDERTLRGEKLMLQMQGEQRKMAHTVDRIAEHLHVAPEVAQTKMVATVTEMLLDVGEEAGLTRDAEDTE